MTLRGFRIVFSSVAFVIITALFLDITNRIPPSWSVAITAFQFGPALLKTFSAVGFAAVGVAVVVLLTLLFGRVYCSHLCPLGALQDIVIWFRNGKTKHRTFPYRPAQFTLHYFFTVLIIITAVAGSLVLLNLFEPFSSYGRMLTAIVRPAVLVVNNATAIVLTSSNSLGIAEIPIYGFTLWNFSIPILFLIMIIALTWWRGRLFCNLLCPVGGVLSLLSRFSLYKITIKGTECIDCGLCERVCRAECIDSKNRTIDFAACVGCFDCIGSCSANGMSYTYQRRMPVAPKTESDRRIVLMGLSAALIDTTGIRNIPGVTTAEGSAYAMAKKIPAVPPGGLSQNHFEQFCTACHRCIGICPTHVLQPSFLEYGFAGILQPKMDFDVNYCNYDCTLCGEVCPTGAILPRVRQEKKQIQVGKVTFVKEDCIVETRKKDCGACAEHCPTKAVKMVPYGKIFIPEIDNQYCVGCGACEHACPTIPRKAIYVTPNSVHLTAKIRDEKRIDAQDAVPEEFPF
jgi:ferredoxin